MGRFVVSHLDDIALGAGWALASIGIGIVAGIGPALIAAGALLIGYGLLLVIGGRS